MKTAKHIVYRAVNRALALTLIGAILSVGAYAIHLTHVRASITVTFGDEVAQQAAMAPLIDMAQLSPLPLRKPVR